MELIKTMNEASKNAKEFNKLKKGSELLAYKNFGNFSNWYYFPDFKIFAPNKFIGYKDTKVTEYAGGLEGHGTNTKEALSNLFEKIDSHHERYGFLKTKLKEYAKSIGREISEKTFSTGGIYLPLIKIPKFSEWQHFDNRKKLDINNAGVYLLAHFDEEPNSNFTLDNLVYVGETTNIQTRLASFRRSAFFNTFAHSGGSTYFNKHLLSNTRKNSPDNLYVAILTLSNNSDKLRKDIERAIIHKYIQQYNVLPSCNKI